MSDAKTPYAPVVVDGRGIPPLACVMTSDLVSEEVRGLSAVSLRVWLALIAICGMQGRHGWVATVEFLAKLSGGSSRQVYRSINELVALGLVQKKKFGRANKYILTSPGQRVRHAGTSKAVTQAMANAEHVTRATNSEEANPDTGVTNPDTGDRVNPDTGVTPTEREEKALNVKAASPLDMTAKTTNEPDEDAIRSKPSPVDTMNASREVTTLPRTPYGRLLKTWIDSQLDGLSPHHFEVERDLIGHKLRAADDGIASFLVDSGELDRTPKHRRHDEAKRLVLSCSDAATSYADSLRPPPMENWIARQFTGHWDEIAKHGLRDRANDCRTEDDVSDVIHALVMAQTGYVI